MSVDLERPDWHGSASCRSDGRWLVDKLTRFTAETLREVCRSCPVAGECLAEALDLDPVVRTCGVLRVGILGARAWRPVEALVAEVGPVTAADWTAVAVRVLEGDPVVRVVRERRRPGVGRRVTKRARRVEPVAGGFPTLWSYDVTPAGEAMTRTAILAARSA